MRRKWFTEDHRLFQERVHRFVEREIIPHINMWEEERQIPRELWYQMGAQGFLCPWLPDEYGGGGSGL